MAVQKVFKRYEYKYLLTREQKELLQNVMEEYMIPDEYGKSTICNLYFDTPQYLLIRRSIENNAGFVRTLAILPAVVCIVIMMVNGNVGTGLAVAGAFSLVRFRSVPGSAKEIGAIFIAMGAGLVSGMGYLGYAVLYMVILSLVMALYVQIRAWEKNAGSEKTMVITIPEDLDYTEVFDDLLEAYTSRYELTEVKTTNMGSLFKLTYQLSLKDTSKEKEMIDHLRCRNGNLEIMVKNQETTTTSL